MGLELNLTYTHAPLTSMPESANDAEIVRTIMIPVPTVRQCLSP